MLDFLRRTPKYVRSYAKVSLEQSSYIRLEIVGHSSAKLIEGPQGTTIKVNRLIRQLQQEKKPVNMLMNVRRIISTDSMSRNHVMTLGDRGVERIAVVGVNGLIRPLVPYVLRVLNKTTITRFFSTEAEAVYWLMHEAESLEEVVDRRSFAAPLTIAIALSSLILYGWIADLDTLKSLIPGALPVNPLVAALLGLLSLALLAYRRWPKSELTHWLTAIPAGAILVFCATEVIRFTTVFDARLDQLLFTGNPELMLESARPKPGMILSLLVLSLLVLSAITKGGTWVKKKLFYPALYTVLTIALLVLVAHGLNAINPDGIVKYTFGAALLVGLIGYSLNFLGPKVLYAQRLNQASQKQWAAIIVFLTVFTFTCIGWRYTNSEVQLYSTLKVQSQYLALKTNLEDRFNQYVESLEYVRGYFYGSDVITATGYEAYVRESKILQNNPGISSVLYVKHLKPNEIAAHETLVKTRLAPKLSNYADYKVFPKNNGSDAYVVTYIHSQRNLNAILGYDLASNPVRAETLTRSLQLGTPQATGTLNLNESGRLGKGPIPGFFITLPLYEDVKTLGIPVTPEEREKRITGFVNAYFRFNTIFDKIFDDLPAEGLDDELLCVYIHDERTKELLYARNAKSADKDVMRDALMGNLNVVGNTWRLTVVPMPGYGVPVGARTLPYATLVGGLLLTVITTATVYTLGRRREQAVELAKQMTEDLSQERNLAVENQKKEEAILASIGDAVFAIDTDKRIVVFNPATEKLSGYMADEVIGQPYTDILKFVYEGSDKVSDQFINRALTGHITTMDDQTMLITKHQKQIPVADSAAPIRDNKGNITGAIVVFRDVTADKALERSKDEFVSVASHQLRTPLSAMNWYTEMLLNGDAGEINKEQESYLREIYIGNKRMTELVGSLLDTSRLDLGKLDSKPEPVDILDLVQSLRVEMEPLMKHKVITYTQKISTEHKTLVTDRKLIRMILQNLLSNAFKYTPDAGRVSLEAVDVTGKHNKPYVQFTVSDTGYGIPESQQSKIFNKMYRADNVLEMEGTGLGLYIVKEAVHKLGGDITFTSVENEGTIFTAEIPVKKIHTDSADVLKEEL